MLQRKLKSIKSISAVPLGAGTSTEPGSESGSESGSGSGSELEEMNELESENKIKINSDELSMK